jgi:hypothetical protein
MIWHWMVSKWWLTWCHFHLRFCTFPCSRRCSQALCWSFWSSSKGRAGHVLVWWSHWRTWGWHGSRLGTFIQKQCIFIYWPAHLLLKEKESNSSQTKKMIDPMMVHIRRSKMYHIFTLQVYNDLKHLITVPIWKLVFHLNILYVSPIEHWKKALNFGGK